MQSMSLEDKRQWKYLIPLHKKKSQILSVALLMRMDFYAGNIIPFFVFRNKWISLLHCDSKCSLWSWRVSVGPPLCALPAVCLVSVCPHGSLDCCCLHPVHCPCFCVRHWARLHWLLRRSVCGVTLFWLLASTDDACWQCFCVLDAPKQSLFVL